MIRPQKRHSRSIKTETLYILPVPSTRKLNTPSPPPPPPSPPPLAQIALDRISLHCSSLVKSAMPM